MIKLNQQFKVYIICPANFATGGPEALHQLAYTFRKLNFKAYMHYLPMDCVHPVHPNFIKYRLPFEPEIENSPKSLVIFPETMLSILAEPKYSQTHKMIWWLSVDNYLAVLKQAKKPLLSKINAFLRGRKPIPPPPDLKDLAKDKSIYHLAQSAYALDFLNKQHIENVANMPDFFHADFIQKSSKIDFSAKKNQVLYNPKKGIEFTQRIIDAAPEINWIPLENMSPKEVVAQLTASKVYIDFGHHPGKDRLPREAVLMGCCIITGKQGSARFWEDLPIPETFKFEAHPSAIPAIIARIKTCFFDFDNQQAVFADYAAQIKAGEQEQEEQLKKLFL